MKRRITSMLVAAAALMVLTGVTANTALADSKGFKNYARLTTGINIPTGDLDDAGYDTGLNLAGSYGRYLAPNLVVEGTLGSFFSDQDFSGRTTATGSYDRDDQFSASFILGTLKGEIPMGPLTLFAGGGVGIYGVVLESEIDTVRLGDLEADDTDSVFGAHVTVGGYYDIKPRVFLGFEGLYRWTTEYNLRDTVGTIPVKLEGNLNGYAISIIGGFRF